MSTTESPGPGIWDAIARWTLYLIMLATILSFLPLTANYVDTNKVFLVSVLAIIGLIAWLARAISVGAVPLPKSALMLAVLVWVLVTFLSALWSIDPNTSLWNLDGVSFFSVAVSALVALLAVFSLRTYRDVAHASLVLYIGATLLVLFEVVQLLLGIDVFPWGITTERTFNLIGTWNSLGLFFGFLLVTAMPFVTEGRTRLLRVLWGVLGVSALLLAAIVNFAPVWIGVGFVALIFVAYNISSGARKRFGVPLALLLISVFLLLAQNQIGALVSAPRGQGGVFSGGLTVPFDVSPTLQSTLAVAKSVIAKSPVLGFGPGTFGYAWELFKDRAVNDSVFWSLRFSAGSSAAATLLATTGVLGLIAFLAILATFSLLAIKTLSALRASPDRAGVVASFLGTLFLLFAWFLYPVSAALVFLTFASLGICIVQARNADVMPEVFLPIISDSVRGFAYSLFIIFLMVLGVVGLYTAGQKYVAAVVSARAPDVLSDEGSISSAERYFTRAASLDPGRDEYARSLAQTSFLKLQRIVQSAGSRAPADVRNDFQLALSNAISNARSATNANPADAINWRLLGQIYEAVIPFATGADASAVEAYTKAIERSPVNPALRDDIARVYITMGNYAEAKKQLEEAVRLKPDFAAAHFRLAQVAALKGDMKEATRSTENAALSAPTDVGVLFQLGLLYYQQSRFPEASQVLERAVAINHNYANARYFLGLAYSGQGQHDKAIEQFSKIAELNPGNKEILAILANLQSGKDPLAGISPPNPAPAKRKELPVGEKTNPAAPSQRPAPARKGR